MFTLSARTGYLFLIPSFILLNFQVTLCRRGILSRDEIDYSSENSYSSKDSYYPDNSYVPSGRRARISGYYPAYNARIQSPSQINFGLYTDLIFFVATTQPGFTLGYGTIPDSDWDPLVTDFVQRCKAAKVKPRLSVGGWTGSIYFSDLLQTDEKRQQYAQFLKSYAQKFGFEGLDVDWEFPTQDGIGCNKKRPEDVANFGSFLANLRQIWPEGEFTAAVSVGGIKSSNGTLSTDGVNNIVNSLDYVNIMAYDVFGGWSSTTGPNAPLNSICSGQSAGKASVVDSIEIYQGHGFKRSQLVMGIPGYGHSFTLTSPNLTTTSYGGVPSNLYQNKSAVVPPGGNTDDGPGVDVCGAKTNWGGSWRYGELIERGFLSKDGKKGINGKERHFDKCTGTPYLTNSTWLLSYDDEESGNLKAQVVKSKGLAGIFYFDTQGPTDSVIRAARSTLAK